MDRDIVIAIVGGLLLVSGMGYTYVNDVESAQPSFTVTWATRVVEGPGQEGYTAASETTALNLDVTTKNLSRAVFILEWTDEPLNAADPDNPPDRFRLKVTNPDGALTDERIDSSGRIEIAIGEVNLIPPTTSEFGSTREEVNASLASKYTGTRGVGTWRLEIEDSEAGHASQGGVTIVMDPGNGWRLRSQLLVYEPQF